MILRIVTMSIILMLASLPCDVQAHENAVLNSCQTLVSQKFKQWKFAPVTAEVAEFTKHQNVNPNITYGDFDGDGHKDVALLIQHGSNPDPEYPGREDSLHIAVCLSKTGSLKLYLIDKPYCGDGIAISRKGQRYYDYDTNKEGTYKRDGVSAYCFEKSGATYQFKNGSFHEIVDSD